MTSSPAKQSSNVPSPTSSNTAHHLSSPRSTRGLRKLQSAHQLSSNYAALNAPSLISQQRQQQRNASASQNQGLPNVPPIPAQHSPNKPAHHRTRSNSDAVPTNKLSTEVMPTRPPPPRRQITFQSPKDQLKSLISHGTKGDVRGSLRRLRHLILEDGLEADNDGMVRVSYGGARCDRLTMSSPNCASTFGSSSSTRPRSPPTHTSLSSIVARLQLTRKYGMTPFAP